MGSYVSILMWMSGLVVKLLEITHGHYIYRNLRVHDDVAGKLVTERKEELQLEIERQMSWERTVFSRKICFWWT